MSQSLPIRKTLRFFTMVEMIAVMAVAGVLLTITVSLSVNDSSKANSRIMKGALQSAHVNALSRAKHSKDYTVLELVTGSKQIEVYYHEWDANTDQYVNTRELISQHLILDGAKISTDHATAAGDIYVAFNFKGEPMDTDGYDGDGEDLNTVDVLSNSTSISFVREDSGEVPPKIYIKPFTGKVTFY